MPEFEALDLGFAEFAAKLISEVVDAVAASQVEQEQRHAELVEASRLAPHEFAESHLTEQEVETELARRFPPESREAPHAIVPGARVRPAVELRELAVELAADRDFTKLPRQPPRLEEPGVEKIRQAVRLQMAEERLVALGELLARGVPRVLVDSGRVNAKLTFEVVTIEEAETPARASRLAAPLRRLGTITRTPERFTLPDVRLVVRQADERSPQASSVNANVYGEVEITFKTVT